MTVYINNLDDTRNKDASVDRAITNLRRTTVDGRVNIEGSVYLVNIAGECSSN